MSGVPTPAEVRRLVRRGSSVAFPLDEGIDMPTVMRLARSLKEALPPDMHVIGSPGRPPSLRVLQLVSDQEMAGVMGALERLVGDFRLLSRQLVERQLDEAVWHADVHGEHCRFENTSGVVVEANVDDPDDIDPYFLLLFAQTSGGYPEVLSVCREGFHDMCRLLDAAPTTWR